MSVNNFSCVLDPKDDTYSVANTGGYYPVRPPEVFLIDGKEHILYDCDPNKNIMCRKTGCYIFGGECSRTQYPEYRKKESDDKQNKDKADGSARYNGCSDDSWYSDKIWGQTE